MDLSAFQGSVKDSLSLSPKKSQLYLRLLSKSHGAQQSSPAFPSNHHIHALSKDSLDKMASFLTRGKKIVA